MPVGIAHVRVLSPPVEAAKYFVPRAKLIRSNHCKVICPAGMQRSPVSSKFQDGVKMRHTNIWIGCFAIFAVLLQGCSKDEGHPSVSVSPSPTTTVQPAPTVVQAPAPAPPPAVTLTPPPPAPRHNYAMVDNGTYGYEPALSEEDVRKGTATKPLIMVRYVGNLHGSYVIIVLGQDATAANYVSRISCQLPCDFAKSESVFNDTVVKTETLRVTPESLIGAMLADAASGQLEAYGHPAVASSPTQPMSTTPTLLPATMQVTSPDNGAPSSAQDGAAPLQEASFDCHQAGSIPQYLICHDPELATSDRSLADLVQKARAAALDQVAFGDRIRKQWNYREKTCKDKACLSAWYAYESDVMTKITQSGDATTK